MQGRCFRCNRYGHYANDCFAKTTFSGKRLHDDDDVYPSKNSKARSGVYVLEFPCGMRYVGKSNDIDTRIGQHRRKEVAATSYMRGTPREVQLLSPHALHQDHESWERNEFLAQAQAVGAENVRGWKYTAPTMTEDDVDSIASELCEKYDCCRVCGKKGHFARDCKESYSSSGSDIDSESDDDSSSGSDIDSESDDSS